MPLRRAIASLDSLTRTPQTVKGDRELKLKRQSNQNEQKWQTHQTAIA
ncbi:MAG: hypothetical protein AAGA60_03785 [Cyanobacteria bacterium P01_E01_bin.42]